LSQGSGSANFPAREWKHGPRGAAPKEIDMQNFLSAARRDAAGVLRLYIYLFFRRRWYRVQGDHGTRALYRIVPWVMGALAPWAVLSAILRVCQVDGLVAGAEMLISVLAIVWLAYRVYLIFSPENPAGAGDHIRGATVHDLSDGGQE
jgi:hypothetical protein